MVLDQPCKNFNRKRLFSILICVWFKKYMKFQGGSQQRPRQSKHVTWPAIFFSFCKDIPLFSLINSFSPITPKLQPLLFFLFHLSKNLLGLLASVSVSLFGLLHWPFLRLVWFFLRASELHFTTTWMNSRTVNQDNGCGITGDYEQLSCRYKVVQQHTHMEFVGIPQNI